MTAAPPALPSLSVRTRFTLRAFELRCSVRFALARLRRADWTGAAYAISATSTMLGGGHPALLAPLTPCGTGVVPVAPSRRPDADR